MNIILSMLIGIGKRLVSEVLFTKLFIIAGDALVKSSKNELDDKVFKAVKEQLGHD